MPSIPPSRPKTGHSYEKDIRTDGQRAMRLLIFQDHMCIVYRKGRVFDKNVYDSIHGQKGKVSAYNKKRAEQVVITIKAQFVEMKKFVLFLFTRKRGRLSRL